MLHLLIATALLLDGASAATAAFLTVAVVGAGWGEDERSGEKCRESAREGKQRIDGCEEANGSKEGRRYEGTRGGAR